MPIREGKETFNKDEIIEILKRNVALYKDEKDFVDYIVELAIYLMDRNYEAAHFDEEDSSIFWAKAGAVSSHLPSSGPPAPPGKEPTLVRHQRPADAPPRAEDLRRQREGLSPSPPSPPAADPDIDEGNAPRPFQAPGAPPPPMPEPHAPRAQDPELDLPSEPPRPRPQFSQENNPLMTPTGDALREHGQPLQDKPPLPGGDREGEDRQRHIDVLDRGRTRVYRVVRPYKSSTQNDIPCKVCGAKIPAEARKCPNCGHLI